MDPEDVRQLLLSVFRADQLLPPEMLTLLDALTAPIGAGSDD